MTLPKKVYETIKFLCQLVPLIVTFIGGTFLVIGVSERTVNIILVIVGGIGTLLTGVIQICRANHWKLINEDGTEEDAADDTTPLPAAEAPAYEEIYPETDEQDFVD